MCEQSQFHTGSNPILCAKKKKEHDKHPGPGASCFLLVLRLRRHLLLSLYYQRAHTALSLITGLPFSLQDCRYADHRRAPTGGSRGSVCLCRQLNMVHITNCSCFMIPGSQLFVDLVLTYGESGYRNIFHLSVPWGALIQSLKQFAEAGRTDFLSPLFQMKTLRPRVVKQPVQRHRTSWWQTWNAGMRTHNTLLNVPWHRQILPETLSGFLGGNSAPCVITKCHSALL